MIDIRAKRIATAIEHLKNIGKVHKQQDIAEKMGATESTISRALKGDAKYLTDRFVMRFNKAFGNSFNEDWLINGTGSMLSTETVDDASVSSSNVNGNNSPNVHQSIGGSVNDAALLRENELLREQNEFQKRQIDRLMAMLENK